MCFTGSFYLYQICLLRVCDSSYDVRKPWYRDVKAAEKHKRWAERQRVKTSTTVNKGIFNAVKRLVANIVHKAKSLFFGNEIAIDTSSRQLFNVCDRQIGRKRSSRLPSTCLLHDLPNVFNNYFLQRVQSIRAVLDQQLLSLTSCRLTDQQVDLVFSHFTQ